MRILYVTKKTAIDLESVGFKRTFYSDEKAPFDFYSYEQSEWVLGGQVIPGGQLLAPEEVYKEGTWLPSIFDLINWLKDYSFDFVIKYQGNYFRIMVTGHKGEEIKGKGVSLEHTLYIVIAKILKLYGNNLTIPDREFVNIESVED